MGHRLEGRRYLESRSSRGSKLGRQSVISAMSLGCLKKEGYAVATSEHKNGLPAKPCC